LLELLLKEKFLKYFGDNSVIFFLSSYLRRILRPRCWIKQYFISCRGCLKLDCSSIKFLHDLSSSRRKPDWFLSAILFDWGSSTKGLTSTGFQELLYSFANIFRTVFEIPALGVGVLPLGCALLKVVNFKNLFSSCD